jgi:hypothetical protein
MVSEVQIAEPSTICREVAVKVQVVCILLACVAVTGTGCSSPDQPPADRLRGATYSLELRGTMPLPASLDQDTVTGSVHYSLLADSITFDGRGSATGRNVLGLDYLGSGKPLLVERSASTYTYELDGDGGTLTGVCPPNAPCAPFTLSFVLDGTTLRLLRPTHIVDRYVRSP